MKKLSLIFSIVLLLVLTVIFVNQENLHAALSETGPDAEIYIEQEPLDASIAYTVTDIEGNFEFKDINGLKAGKYNLCIRVTDTKNLKKKLAKKKLLHIHFRIVNIREKGKEDVVFSKTILIKASKALKGKKLKLFHFKLKEDILFWPKSSSTATGSKGGFAVGGFSHA